MIWAQISNAAALKQAERTLFSREDISNKEHNVGTCVWDKLELSLNAIHTPTYVLDKAGTRVRWVLHIAQFGWIFESSLKKILPLV